MLARVFVIAEAGVNHNGSLDRALALVDVAAESGADAVKFQTFHSEAVVSSRAPLAAYQKRNMGTGKTQLEMVKALELSEDAHRALARRCEQKGIEFMSTAFDDESLRFLIDEIGVKRVKIPSGDIDHAPLLLKAAASGLPLIISTGMCGLADVENALGVVAYARLKSRGKPGQKEFKQALRSPRGRALTRKGVTLLHCVTEYPAPISAVNLRAMDALSEAFGTDVGYSDHTEGYSVAVAAAARGASVIEKHFTMDRSLPGPDHRSSLEPEELKAMVRAIREVERALGNGRKVPAAEELQNKAVARRSLVAKRAIGRYEVFSEENLESKRPGDGISPLRYWEFLGKRAGRDYAPDELICPVVPKGRR
jgi:N-acetylneuraminate synthase